MSDREDAARKDAASLFRAAQVQAVGFATLAFVYGVIVPSAGGWAWLLVLVLAAPVVAYVKLIGSLRDLYVAEGNYREAKGHADGLDKAIAITKRSDR